MICKFCGNEIDDNSDFCFICGQKVEAKEPVYAAAPAANVYTQPEAAPAEEPFVADDPFVESTDDAFVSESAPVSPAAAAVATAQKTKKELKAEIKAAKKAEKAAKYAIASRAERFFSVLFALVGLFIYSKAKKEGEDEKAVVIYNIFMTALCVKMGIIIILMVKKFMF